METNLIFTFGRNLKPKNLKHIMEVIKDLDRKPISWKDLEIYLADLARNKSLEAKSIPSTLKIQNAENSDLPFNLMSGCAELKIPSPEIKSKIQDYIDEKGPVNFRSLRRMIWDGEHDGILGTPTGMHWLDFEIRWEITRFMGRVVVYDCQMQSYL